MKKRFNLMISNTTWLCFLFAISLSPTIIAQNTSGKVIGIVSSETGEKLAYATAGITNTSYGATSNTEGYFELELAEGIYTLAISYTGFNSKQLTINVKNNETLDLGTIKLSPSNKVLNEIVVDGMISKFSKKKSDEVARMPLKNLDNPQVYTVVPKELFEEQVSVDFRSALMSSPGVSNVTLGVGSGGTGLTLYMRGFSGSNGAGAIRNGLATNWVSLSDPANLESLEIIKGPSSTLFGSTLVSYGGLVNRVTKKAYNGTGGEVSISTGSNALGRIALDLNTPINKEKTMLFRINTAVHRENSFQDYGRNKTFMFAPTFTYHATDKLTFDFDVEFFNSKRNTTYIRANSNSEITSLDDLNWNFNYSYTSNDFLSRNTVLNGMTKATYQMSDKWKSVSALSYSNTDNDANYLFLMVRNTESIGRMPMNITSTFSTLQFQQNFIGEFKIGGMSNKLLLGADFTELRTSDNRTRLAYYDQVAINASEDERYLSGIHVIDSLAATAPYYHHKRLRRTYSAYASNVINITDQLIAMASLRIDNYNHFDEDEEEYTQTALSPKLGLIYQIIDDKISLFGNYMNGFSNVGPAVTDANGTTENLEPEHANQMEGGVKFELLGNKLNGTLSYYNIAVENKVRSVSDDLGNSYSVQDGTQKSAGFEVDLIANPFVGTHIILGYGYNDSEYTNVSEALDGNRPYSVPEQVANLWISHRITGGKLDGLGIGLGGNYCSEYFYNDANTITVPSYTKLDGTLFYDKPSFRVGLKWNNLTDEEYWMTAYDAEPQKPRTFIMNFTMKF